MFDLREAFRSAGRRLWMPETDIKPAVLNTEEAAAYINRSLRFVRKVLRYEVPVVQHGERQPLYFYRQDLDHWLQRNTHHPVR